VEKILYASKNNFLFAKKKFLLSEEKFFYAKKKFSYAKKNFFYAKIVFPKFLLYMQSEKSYVALCEVKICPMLIL